MKAMNLFVSGLMFMSLGLTACGVVKDAKNANNMKKEGDVLAAEINAEQRKLEDDGVDISSSDSYIWAQWGQKTPEKRADLRKRLVALDFKFIRYIEIAGHKDFETKNIGAKIKAQMIQDNLRTYINSLDKYEGKAQSFPQQKIN